MPLFSANHSSLFLTRCSSIFPIVAERAIGRYELASSGFLDGFRIGIITWVFQSPGISPVSKAWFRIPSRYSCGDVFNLDKKQYDGYTVSDVVMYWKETPVRGVEDAELPQFTILGHETNDRIEKLATGVYQRLSLSFKLRRNIGYFVFQTYLPCILIVMLSWVSFWINHEATSARVALGITTVLTMTTISTGVRSSLPRISYVKAIDIYLVMCFVFVFAALLEYAAVNYTYWGARARKRAKLKKGEMSTSTSVEKDLKCSGGSRSPEEIIALRECTSSAGRVSPLLGLRSKPLPAAAGAPPSLRLQRDHTHLRYRTRPHSRNSKNGSTGKPKMIHALRRGASVIKASMPKIRDVNVIDTYSRVIFPVCFLVFNAVYWVFYIFD